VVDATLNEPADHLMVEQYAVGRGAYHATGVFSALDHFEELPVQERLAPPLKMHHPCCAENRH
jgi:hypothetical protein